MSEIPREVVEIARKVSRQLMLGKGMFFDADALAVLATIGVNDMIQAKAAERLRIECQEKAAQRRDRDEEAVGRAEREAGEHQASLPRMPKLKLVQNAESSDLGPGATERAFARARAAIDAGRKSRRLGPAQPPQAF